MSDNEFVLAVETLDCAEALRLHYFLPAPVEEEFLELFPPRLVTIQRFSEVVEGAKDHFSIRLEPYGHASGDLSGVRVVVVYEKPQGRVPVEAIAAFERALEEGGFGPVRYRSESMPAEPAGY